MKTSPASGRGDLHANQAWIEAHRAEYANEWVALKDGKLVSSAPSRGSLHQQIASRDDARDLLVVFVAGSHVAMPAQKEVWVAVDVNGVPSGAVYATQGSAGVTAAALGQSVPQYGPYRVQQYVTQETLDFSQSWYAARWERLDQLVREEATEEFKSHWFNVMANGTATMHEPPTYAGLLNQTRHTAERQRVRADKAEAALSAMLTGVERGNEEATAVVMHGIIGALQTDDGAVAVRYCGHLERLLEKQRVETERFRAAAAALRPFASEHGAVLCEHAEPAAGNEIRMSHLKAAREAYQAAFPEEH